MVDLSCSSNGAGDAVYRWQPTISGTFIFDTNGSSFDTTLAVYTNCDGSGSEQSCDDDSGTGLQSELSLSAAANQTYYIVVSGFSSLQSGSYSLNYRPIGGCASNAQCASGEICQSGICINDPNAPECSADFECASGELCQNGMCMNNPTGQTDFCNVAGLIGTTGESQSTTDAGSDVFAPSCAQFSDGNDVSYRWSPTTTGTYVVETRGNTDTIISITDRCDGIVSELACDDDSGASGFNGQLSFTAQAFVNYYIVVSASRSFLGGNFQVVVSQEQTEPEPECTFDFECDAGQLCSNAGECVSADESNLCAHALYQPIYGPNYPLVVTGSMEEDVVGNCGNGTSTGGDADFRWFPIRGGEYRLTASADNAGENVSLAVYDDCDGMTTTERACQNRWSNADEEVELSVDLSVRNAYRLVVSGRGFNSDGNITLTIECISGGCSN